MILVPIPRFFKIIDFSFIKRLLVIVQNRLRNRVIGILFRKPRPPNHFFGRKTVLRIYLVTLKTPWVSVPVLSNTSIDIIQSIEIIAAFNQNTAPGSAPDSTEEAQRNGDYQGARAGNYQEHQSLAPFAQGCTFHENKRQKAIIKARNTTAGV